MPKKPRPKPTAAPPPPPPAPLTAAIKTEVVPLASLKQHPRNYRVHPQDQLDHIKKSVTEHGVYRNVVVARDGTILAGHGVTEALKQLGATEVTVVRLDIAPEDPRALKVLTGDNEIGRLAEIDDRLLSELLGDLKKLEQEGGLLGTGFDEMMLANLVFVSRPESELEDFNAAAHWAGLPAYEPVKDPLKVVISFYTAEDRDKLLVLLGNPVVRKKMEKTWCVWWPSRPREVINDKRFEDEGKLEAAAPAPAEPAAAAAE